MKKRSFAVGLFLTCVMLPVYGDGYVHEFSREAVDKSKVWEIGFNTDVRVDEISDIVKIIEVDSGESVEFTVTSDGGSVYKIYAEGYELGKEYRLSVSSSDGVTVDKEYVKNFDITNSVGGSSYLKTVPSDFSEFTWRVYHSNYDKFVLEGVDMYGNVLGGYRTDKIEDDLGIRVGISDKLAVGKLLGEPVEYIEKGNTNYTIDGKDEYETYLVGNRYVTVFYDIYNNGLVRSVLWVDKDLHEEKPSYAKPSDDLATAYEDLMVDLINETRVSFGLRALRYDVAMNNVGRSHSSNMVNQDFFDHVDKDGRSVSDRVKSEGYRVSYVGENLAYGQLNVIYAHEGLMNSLGHRENILNENYTSVGVGVKFKDDGTPYFTVVFYSN